MKKLLLLLTLFASVVVRAQTSKAALDEMMKQADALSDAHMHDQAIDKYQQVLKLDSTYVNAYLDIAEMLYADRKKTDAIPYLQKMLRLDPKSAAGYNLLGNIYDDFGESEKAIALYKKGIEAAPNFQRLYHNISVCYYNQDKFAEAEQYALQAIKLEPGYANSLELYALTTYKQRKHDKALLAWCGFLMLENRTARSIEANRYITEILNYGITKTGKNSIKVTVQDNDLSSVNMLMQMAALTAADKKKDLSPADSVSLQLTEVFKVIAKSQTDKASTFNTTFAQYFDNLANSKNMPAFTRFITMAANREVNQAWFKEHQAELDSLIKWTTDNKTTF